MVEADSGLRQGAILGALWAMSVAPSSLAEMAPVATCLPFAITAEIFGSNPIWCVCEWLGFASTYTSNRGGPEIVGERSSVGRKKGSTSNG